MEGDWRVGQRGWTLFPLPLLPLVALAVSASALWIWVLLDAGTPLDVLTALGLNGCQKYTICFYKN